MNRGAMMKGVDFEKEILLLFQSFGGDESAEDDKRGTRWAPTLHCFSVLTA